VDAAAGSASVRGPRTPDNGSESRRSYSDRTHQVSACYTGVQCICASRGAVTPSRPTISLVQLGLQLLFSLRECAKRLFTVFFDTALAGFAGFFQRTHQCDRVRAELARRPIDCALPARIALIFVLVLVIVVFLAQR